MESEWHISGGSVCAGVVGFGVVEASDGSKVVPSEHRGSFVPGIQMKGLVVTFGQRRSLDPISHLSMELIDFGDLHRGSCDPISHVKDEIGGLYVVTVVHLTSFEPGAHSTTVVALHLGLVEPGLHVRGRSDDSLTH